MKDILGRTILERIQYHKLITCELRATLDVTLDAAANVAALLMIDEKLEKRLDYLDGA